MVRGVRGVRSAEEGAELGLSEICTLLRLDLRPMGEFDTDTSVPVLSVSRGGSSGSYTCSVTSGVSVGSRARGLKLTLRLEEGYRTHAG